MSQTEDERPLLLLRENVPHGATLYLLSCTPLGIHRLSLSHGAPIGGGKIGDGSYAAAQISENEIVRVSTISRTPIVYNVMNGREIATLAGGHTKYLYGIAFLPQSLLVTGGEDKAVVVWNRRRSADPPFAVKCQLEGHTDQVKRLDAWEESNGFVVSGSNDKTVRVWDVLREECVSVLQGHRGTVYALCHDSEKQIQFTGSVNRTVIAWDFRLPQQHQHQKILQVGVSNEVQTLCYRPKQSQLIVPCWGGPLRVIDIRMLRSDNPTTSVVHEWNTGHSGCVCGSCDVSDENWDFFVTSGYNDKHVKAWKENGKCVWDWEAPRGADGIHRFIRGDPADARILSSVSRRVECDEEPRSVNVTAAAHPAVAGSGGGEEERGDVPDSSMSSSSPSSPLTPSDLPAREGVQIVDDDDDDDGSEGREEEEEEGEKQEEEYDILRSLLSGTLQRYYTAFLGAGVEVDLLPDILDDEETLEELIPVRLHRRVFVRRARAQLQEELSSKTTSPPPPPFISASRPIVAVSVFALDCPVAQNCYSVIRRLHLPDEAFDHGHSCCFCDNCCLQRGEQSKTVIDHLPSGSKSTYPRGGWVKFAVHVHPHAIGVRHVFDWQVAYHGTTLTSLREILESGGLLHPGDVTHKGMALPIRECHIDYKRVYPKERALLDGEMMKKRQVLKEFCCSCFVSPSLKYASQREYAQVIRVGQSLYQAVLQVRIEPGSFRDVLPCPPAVPGQTHTLRSFEDPLFDPDVCFEWFTNRANVIVLTGVLIRRVHQ